MHRVFCIVALSCACFSLAAAEEDATETEALEAKLAEMRLQKEVLEGQSKITTVVRTLATIGASGDGVFDIIKEFAEEGHRLLDEINAADTWADKLELVNAGLTKRSEWIEQLTALKDAMEQGPDDEEGAETEKEEVQKPKPAKKAEKKPVKDEMDDPDVMKRTAKVLVKAVRDGNIEMVVKLMTALGEKPAVLAKLVMWPDEKTGANLLHWCSFYGTDAHIALTQTFMRVPGVDASVVDNHHHTACQTACVKNHPGVLEHLMTKHEDSTPCDPFEIPSGSGANCLHFAAKGGHTKLLELLAPRVTTDILELTTTQGSSATSLAAESGSAEAVQILSKAALKAYSDYNKEEKKASAKKSLKLEEL